ncbi:metallophosphoesterase [Deinococcus wulumuqiensis]|uniref:Phosphatase n=1 Tax=Deinococcus wulumuqiensis TaxID=980427 RepID=A0AAV4K365_9DEIO|nr:metallophosphoesterase [Deinococcus wulumuqiensis]QII20607.1 metallophosphoesterase [Deinococcus wulumuqiensis R12]GGI72766.1 phosphatase [Deinococcus wulumuqiensis]GGP28561.1 phosphatase [Deinococcus wulumuqiensis]
MSLDPLRPEPASASACPLWVVGDIHGAHDKLRALLLRAGLTDALGRWTGGAARLVFLGDYFDRGPDGLGVLRLVRSLEAQARAAGGEVTALLGNHEVMFLAAALFREHDPRDRLGFFEYWRVNGGQLSDLERLAPDDLAWLRARPLLAHAQGWLLLHADSPFYLGLGDTVPEVNARAAELLLSSEAASWSAFANAFVDRLKFAGPDGAAQARRVLERFGGERLVHGHTPTPLLLQGSGHDLPDGPTVPVLYAEGLCLALDSGMAYFPEAGFVARLGELAPQGRPERLLTELVTLPPEFVELPLTGPEAVRGEA